MDAFNRCSPSVNRCSPSVNSTEENRIGGRIGQEGERRKSYSAAVIDGKKRKDTIYVGDSIMRKTDSRLSKGEDVVVCLPGARIEHVTERVEKIMGRGNGASGVSYAWCRSLADNCVPIIRHWTVTAVRRTNTSRVRACVIRSAIRFAEFRYLGFNTAANTSQVSSSSTPNSPFLG